MPWPSRCVRRTRGESNFYDALETNDSAGKILGEPTLKTIAHELAERVRSNVTIDWTVRENVRAHLRAVRGEDARKRALPGLRWEAVGHRNRGWNKDNSSG